MAVKASKPQAANLLTTNEVAARWRMSPETVRAMARSGELRGFVLVKRGWRFERGEVERYEAIVKSRGRLIGCAA